jgi:hypothetical protein
MIKYALFGALMWLLIGPQALAQQKQSDTTADNRIVLGWLASSADVAFVLLHDTKSRLALPGRMYELLGPGSQVAGDETASLDSLRNFRSVGFAVHRRRTIFSAHSGRESA